MGHEEETVERVRRTLAGREDVAEVRLMGGLTFMVNGNMCCSVNRGTLMVRVGPEGYREALAREHVRPLEFGGKAPVGYVRIDPEGHRSDEDFAAWMQKAVAFVETLPAKKRAVNKPAVKK